MSHPSSWPLPVNSVRYLFPRPVIRELELNILSRGLYPLSFGKYQQAHGHAISRGEHTDHLLIFCVDGRGYYRTAEQQGQLQAGEILILPKGDAHQYGANIDDPWTIYWVHLEGHLFPQFMDFIGIDSQHLSMPVTHQQELINEFDQLLETRHQSYKLSACIYAANILKKLFGLLTLATKSQGIKSTTDFDLWQATSFMEENIDQALTLEQMAAWARMSKFHFAKKFQQITGISPIKFFLQLKIKHSCQLLDQSNASIKTVAESLGYDDPYYFSRLFKKVMGISPKQYRLSRHGH